MTIPDPLQAALAPQGFAVLAVLARILAMLMLFPGFGERTLPLRLKMAIAFALSVPVVFLLGLRVTPATPAEALGIPLREAAHGLIFGFAFRLAFHALEIAGSIMANATSLAQLAGGDPADPDPAIARLLTAGGLCLLAVSGVPERLVEFVALSYELFPPAGAMAATAAGGAGAAAAAEGQPLAGVGRVILLAGRAFALAVALAAPLLAVSLAYNILIGAVNRAMPQMMVALVGAPLISLLALYGLWLAAPHLLAVWAGLFPGFPGGAP